MIKRMLAIAICLFPLACANAQGDLPFNVEEVTSFDEPWADNILCDHPANR